MHLKWHARWMADLQSPTRKILVASPSSARSRLCGSNCVFQSEAAAHCAAKDSRAQATVSSFDMASSIIAHAMPVHRSNAPSGRASTCAFQTAWIHCTCVWLQNKNILRNVSCRYAFDRSLSSGSISRRRGLHCSRGIWLHCPLAFLRIDRTSM